MQLENKNLEVVRVPETAVSTSIEPLIRSFERHLRAENKRAPTISHYIGAARQFAAFAQRENLPGIEDISREHVEMWLERLHLIYKPHSVRNRFIGVRIFFRWLLAENEIQRDPTARIKPPHVDQVQKDIVSPEDMARVLEDLTKAKKHRDALIIAILYDCGLRASELANLRTEDVNPDTGLIVVTHSKGRRPRVVKLSNAGLRYLDRYLRRLNPLPEYLLAGKRGPMTRSGIYQVVRETFERAGVKGTIGAHDLRHTSASHVVGEMSESAMMALYGWTDPAMARHYAQQALEAAALAAHDKASPLQRLGK
jgi:site-specific recombinase XerD